MEAPEHSATLLGMQDRWAVGSLLAAEEIAGRAEPAARRRRQIGLVRIGRHPISLYLRRAFSSGLLLHSQAPRQIDARPSPYRCGTCRFLVCLEPEKPATPFKCMRWPELTTRGAATDVRKMWPACRNWLPKEKPDGHLAAVPPAAPADAG
jgi:hypothetical protein